MITVYLYDGTPIDIWHVNDAPEESTIIPPTDGLYEPIQFDPETNTWLGSQSTEIPEEPIEPDDKPENNTNNNLDESVIANVMFENSMLKFNLEEAQSQIEILKEKMDTLIPDDEVEDNE